MSNVIAMPSAARTTTRTIDRYPDIMDAKHVKEYLGVSEAFAYQVLNSENCPAIRMGKRIKVAKASFLKFLADSEGKKIF